LLLGAGITAAGPTDHVLGRALDKVAAAGRSNVVGEVAAWAMLHGRV